MPRNSEVTAAWLARIGGKEQELNGEYTFHAEHKGLSEKMLVLCVRPKTSQREATAGLILIEADAPAQRQMTWWIGDVGRDEVAILLKVLKFKHKG